MKARTPGTNKFEQEEFARNNKSVRFEFGPECLERYYTSRRKRTFEDIAQELNALSPRANITVEKVRDFLTVPLDCPAISKYFFRQLRQVLKKKRMVHPHWVIIQTGDTDVEWSQSDRKWFEEQGMKVKVRNLKEERKAMVEAKNGECKFIPQEFVCPKCGIKTLVEHQEIWDEYQEAGLCIRCEMMSKKNGDPIITPGFAERTILSSAALSPVIEKPKLTIVDPQKSLLRGVMPADGSVISQARVFRGKDREIQHQRIRMHGTSPERLLNIVTHDKIKTRRKNARHPGKPYTHISIGDWWLNRMGWHRTHWPEDRFGKIQGTRVVVAHYFKNDLLVIHACEEEGAGRVISGSRRQTRKSGTIKLDWVEGMTIFKRIDLSKRAELVVLDGDIPAIMCKLPPNAYKSKIPPQDLWADPPWVKGHFPGRYPS